jgi:hypothetical protein
MKKGIIAVLLAVSVCLGGNLNYTSTLYRITGFKADSLKYTPVFGVSDWENFAVSIGWDDGDAAGFGGDSAKFCYFAQFGWPTENSTGNVDTFWLPTNYGIDTLKDSAGYWGIKASQMDSTGVLVDRGSSIDTTSVSGLCTSGRTLSVPWAVFGRIGIKGLTGNNVGSNLKMQVNVVRRNALKTDGR